MRKLLLFLTTKEQKNIIKLCVIGFFFVVWFFKWFACLVTR